MSKCVVEGCGEEYDVTCSFSFYNVNTTSASDPLRQEWVEGALQEDSECLWRHVSLQLCAYHFESDQQGLWIESPVLPELLTVHTEPDLSRKEVPVPAPGGPPRARDSYQGSFESFVKKDVIKLEHNYSAGVPRGGAAEEGASRLNVRHLVDALGYLSLKNLQRKQLWVVNVEGGGAEASVTQAEQVIAKMQDAKQIIEIIPPSGGDGAAPEFVGSEVLEIMEETTIPDNFIYEIAEEQEVCAEEVQEIPYVKPSREWMVSIVPEEPRQKYAFIKHCTGGKKRRHFQQREHHEQADQHEMTFHDNIYILPDADPSVGIEVTTSYETESFAVDPYQHLVLQEPATASRRRSREPEPWEVEPARRRRRRAAPTASAAGAPATAAAARFKSEPVDWEVREEAQHRKLNNRARRKNKKYVGYDFVT